MSEFTIIIRPIKTTIANAEENDLVNLRFVCDSKISETQHVKYHSVITWNERFEMKFSDPNSTLTVVVYSVQKGSTKIVGELAIPLQLVLDTEDNELDETFDLKRAGKNVGKIQLRLLIKGNSKLSWQLLKRVSLATTGSLNNIKEIIQSGQNTTKKDTSDSPKKEQHNLSLSGKLLSKDPKREKKVPLSARTFRDSDKEPLRDKKLNKSRSVKKKESTQSADSFRNKFHSKYIRENEDWEEIQRVEEKQKIPIEEIIRRITKVNSLNLKILAHVKKLLLEDEARATFLEQGGFLELVSKLCDPKIKSYADDYSIAILDIVNSNISFKEVFENIFIKNHNNFRLFFNIAFSSPHPIKVKATVNLAAIPHLFKKAGVPDQEINHIIIDAINYYNYKTGEKQKFRFIIPALNNENEELDVALFSFINSLVNTEMDLEERMSLRVELLESGLKKIINKRRDEDSSTTPKLAEEIEKFLFNQEKDEAAIIESLQFEGDFNDEKLLEKLLISTKKKVSKNPIMKRTFVQIMHRLVNLPCESFGEVYKWIFIERVLTLLNNTDKNVDLHQALEKLFSSLKEELKGDNNTEEHGTNDILKLKLATKELEIAHLKEQLQFKQNLLEKKQISALKFIIDEERENFEKEKKLLEEEKVKLQIKRENFEKSMQNKTV